MACLSISPVTPRLMASVSEQVVPSQSAAGTPSLGIATKRMLAFLTGAYAKNEKDNLTKAERNALEKMANAIFEKNGS